MSTILISLFGFAAIVLWIGWLVCFVMVLIKLFQQKGALHGILGILCGLYTFIWGWIESTRLGLKKIMMIWTAIFIAAMVLQGIVAVFAVSAAGPQFQAELKRQQELQQQQQGR